MARRIGMLNKNVEFAALIHEAVRELGHESRTFASTSSLGDVGRGELDALLVDYQSFVTESFASLNTLRSHGWPLLVVSDVEGERHAVAALRGGADHYLHRRDLAQLGQTIEEATTSPSALQRAETALHVTREAEQAHQRFVAVLEATPDFVAMATMEGTPLYINHAGRRMLGFEEDQPLHLQHIRDFHPPGSFERITTKGLPRALSTGSWSGETILLHRDGHEIPVWQVLICHRGADNEPLYLSTIMRSLVELRHLEAQLRHSQKMEAIGRLAAGVAHDFNNLLTIISGYAELVLGGGRLLDGWELPEFVASSLQQILKAGEQAAGLTRQLLAFSGKKALAPVILEPNALVTNLEKMLQRLVGEEVQLRSIPGAAVGLVRADAGQLEQVVLNLVVNARDAILDPANRPDSSQGILHRPSGGQVTITTATIHFAPDEPTRHPESRPGRFIRLSVKDNGCGMSEEVKTRIFEPFFTTKPEGKGSGLGLATVYSIVQQSNGWIEVESVPLVGSTFHVFLPVIEGALPATGISQSYESLSGNESILLVEDEEQVRRLAGESLRAHGYQVHEAWSGAEAIDRLVELSLVSGNPVDLVLTDVVMPGMSGRRLAAEVARLWPFVPVVFMSGYTEDHILRRGVKTGTVHYLQKPFTPLVLVRTIRGVLDQRAKESSRVFAGSGADRGEVRA